MKSPLNFREIFNVNFGFLGINFAFIMQMANISGIYTFLGAKQSELGLLWLASPIGGLLAQVLVGYLSDRTSKTFGFGRRLPYIFLGSIITAISMIMLPNAQSITQAVIFLCVFIVFLNVAMQPYRSFVCDIVPENSQTEFYAMQMIFVGVGSICAAVLPWLLFSIGKASHAEAQIHVPIEIKIAFYIGALVLLLSNFWTTFASKKYVSKKDNKPLSKPKKTSVSAFFKEIPKIMWQISLVQFFAWAGFFCFLIYLTPLIAKNIFYLDLHLANADSSDYQSIMEKSEALTNLSYAVYTFANIVFAAFIPLLMKIISRKKIHIIALVIGGLSLLMMGLVHYKIYFLATMVGFGVAWASVNSIPYAMIASSIPRDKIGLYMGIFNINICLPQIVIGLLAGPMLRLFLNSNVANIILLAGILLIVAAITTIFYLHDKKSHEISLKLQVSLFK